MRLWILLLIGLIVSQAKVVKRQAGEVSDVVNEFEDSSAPEGEAVEATQFNDNQEENEEAVDNQEQNEEVEEAQEGEGEEEQATEENEDQAAEESSDADEGQENAQQNEGTTEEENSAPADENIEAEIAEETEEPATEEDETEQPANSQPTEENTETSDSTGQSDALPPSIATDVPKEEKPIDATAVKPWTDEMGWTHYPWKKFPINKFIYTKTKDCGCQVKWIKKVYKRWQPKPRVYLAHSTYINLHRRKPCHRHRRPIFPIHHHHHTRRPCRRHRHHHHVFHPKPLRTVQHVVYNHHSKPCFKKPIITHITKIHNVGGGRFNRLH